MSNHYISAESKYKDNLDSAISLLIVGILGITVIVLINLNVINLNLQSTTKLLMTILMGLLFLMFVIFGIKSIITSKKFKSNISTEKNILEEIRTYLIKNIDIKNVDSNLDISEFIESGEFFAPVVMGEDKFSNITPNQKIDYELVRIQNMIKEKQ